MTSNVLENLTKTVRKSPQNTSKIGLEGGLEAAWEPPLSGGDPKTSFLGDFGSTLGLHLGTSFGSFWASFFMFFDMSSVAFLVIWGPFVPYWGGLLGYVFGSLFQSLRKP